MQRYWLAWLQSMAVSAVIVLAGAVAYAASFWGTWLVWPAVLDCISFVWILGVVIRFLAFTMAGEERVPLRHIER